MRDWLILFLSLVLFLFAAGHAATLETTFPPPDGYSRIEADSTSFTHYLRLLNVLPAGELVRRWDGTPVRHWPQTVRVLDLPFLFNSDLEQCADICFRLFADYAHSLRADSLLDFRLQNGQAISWHRWKRGKRLRYDPVSGRHLEFTTPANSSRKAFRDFLHYLFQWAGTAAMKEYLQPISESQLQPGDLIVQNTTGGMGHVSIILDKCVAESGAPMYIIANGWTPAQTPFIWKAGEKYGSDYWFTIDGYRHQMAPLDFGPFEFRTFRKR